MSAVLSCTTSLGHDIRLIRSPRSAAITDQPSYLRAWTMLDAGSTGIQQTERTARTNGGRSSHQRQTLPCTGWPHRSHFGAASNGNLDQHRPHTTPVSSWPISRSQATQLLGRSSSSAYPRMRLAGLAVASTLEQRLTHRLAIGLDIEPAVERERSLFEKHRQAIGSSAAFLAGRFYPRRSATPVYEIEHRCALIDHSHVDRLIVIVLSNRSRVDDQRRSFQRFLQRRFDAGDIAETSRQFASFFGIAGDDRHLGILPRLGGGENR